MSNKLKLFMSTEGIDGKQIDFAFDEKNNLHINGKKVVTREIIQLRSIELVALCITTLAVSIQAVFAILEYFKC